MYEDRNSLLSCLQRFTIPDGSNSTQVPGVDETSRANGYRWSGVVADFLDEGIAQSTSYPKLKATQFAAEKLIGVAIASAELASDVVNFSAFLERAFADEMAFQLERYSLGS